MLASVPGERLVFAWFDDAVRMAVAADGESRRLVLADLLDAENATARNAAGWRQCLDQLTVLLRDG